MKSIILVIILLDFLKLHNFKKRSDNGFKVEKIKYTDHKLFNNLEIDFKESSDDTLNTIVIIGENGVGKTTLLKSIYDAFKIDECTYKEIGNGLTSHLYKVTVKLKDDESSVLHPDGHDYGIDSDKNYPKVVYIPTEINFDSMNKVDKNFNFKLSFQNVIDEDITQNIPSFIATKITREIFRNTNKTIGEVIEKVCADINNIFSVMDLDVKLVGISETNETKPIFRNSLGQEFDITGLSSGKSNCF